MTKAWPVPDIDPNASLSVNGRRILRVRIAEFFAFAPIVSDERAITELHDLRIAAKRLRYTLELFRVAFGDAGETQIERVREIQELLGQLHDSDVRIALIEDELTSLAVEQTRELSRALAEAPAAAHASMTAAALRPSREDPRSGLLTLLARQHAQRHDTYVAFHGRWQELLAAGLRSDLVALSLSVPDSP